MRIALRDLSFETEHPCESSAQNEQSETVQASVAINFFGSTNAEPGTRKSLSQAIALSKRQNSNRAPKFTRRWYVDFSLRNIFGLMITS
jgi:hypothetical protein